MQLSDFQFIKLTNEMTIPTFHCKDEDLNSFLLDDAKKYINDLMAATYLFVDVPKNEVVAYFSLLNDTPMLRISIERTDLSFLRCQMRWIALG